VRPVLAFVSESIHKGWRTNKSWKSKRHVPETGMPPVFGEQAGRHCRYISGNKFQLKSSTTSRNPAIYEHEPVLLKRFCIAMESRQSDASVELNTQYFLEHLKEYQEAVSKIDTYKLIHDFISQKVAGVDRLLDIGNGGVFDYDPSNVGTITAVDLFFEKLPADVIAKYFPPNARAKQGSALEIPEPDGSFDMALMVMLLHHLTGANWQECLRNTQRALSEAWRVVRPGGRLLIVESCVPKWFFRIEKPAFWLLSSVTNSLLSHPITFQFPPEIIVEQLSEKAQRVDVHVIPKGRKVIHLGVKIPAFLTPAYVVAIEAIKGAR
jgi:SAM-dependent methyltransferase